VEAEESHMYGEGRKGWGGGSIHLFGDRPVVGVGVVGGISLNISLVRKAGRLCSPFSHWCTKPSKGREWGCRIALG